MQNATLKLLEECPDYAVIILLVKNPKKLLDTIFSRTITLTKKHESNVLSDEIKIFLKNFLNGNKTEFLSYLFNADIDHDLAKSILMNVFSELDSESQKVCKQYIINLETTNEKPKNIVEAFFLGNNFL